MRNLSIWLVDPFSTWPMNSAYSAIKSFDWVLISCVVCIIQIFRICTLRSGNPYNNFSNNLEIFSQLSSVIFLVFDQFFEFVIKSLRKIEYCRIFLKIFQWFSLKRDLCLKFQPLFSCPQIEGLNNALVKGITVPNLTYSR
jgi:hypothetical protein